MRNAIEAIEHFGQIEIKIEEDDKNSMIHISDTGPGLSEEERRHLFDPFYSARQAGRGLGFGLSKAWRIIEQHRGTITFDAARKVGASFTITLPRQQNEP